jgi:hypothetical protein
VEQFSVDFNTIQHHIFLSHTPTYTIITTPEGRELEEEVCECGVLLSRSDPHLPK